MILKTVLGQFGRKIKILHILHKIACFDLEHQNTNEKVLNDSVKLKMVLVHFGRTIKNLHILHKIAYFDLEHRNNQ